jgi:hypothetical protein
VSLFLRGLPLAVLGIFIRGKEGESLISAWDGLYLDGAEVKRLWAVGILVGEGFAFIGQEGRVLLEEVAVGWGLLQEVAE